MKSEPEGEVEPVNQTKNEFFAFYETSFLVLPNGRTIVGVDGETEKTLVTEDISTNKATAFGKHEDRICTLFYDKVTENLFAGDRSGHVKQYRRGCSDHPFTILKDHGDVGIGSLYSSAQVNGFCFFGGSDSSLVAIDIHGRRLYKGKIKSAYGWILSLQVCHGLDEKVYLSVSVDHPYYFFNNSDFLDVTEIYRMRTMDTNQYTREVNNMLNAPRRKDQMFNLDNLQIKQLDSDIPTEETKTRGSSNKKVLQKNHHQSHSHK